SAPTTSNAIVFDTYSDFARYLQHRKCPSCSTGFIKRSDDVDAIFKVWLSGAAINSQVKCSQCLKSTCIACFDKAGAPTEKLVNSGRNKVSWCCSRGRLFTIFVMLCGFDQKYCSDKYNEASAHNGSKSNRPINSGTGVGYGSGGFLGMFGRPQGQQSYAEDAGKKTAETAERRSDRFDQMIFSFLAVLCPSPGNDHNDDGPLGSFDIQPPKAVASMLVHSKILAKAAELLRNDSLENVTQRSDLYMALIRFLKRVGVHSISKQEVMYTDRVVFPDTVNLLTLALKSTTAGTASTASPLAECLRKLNLQSSMMIRNAQRLRTEFTDVRGQDMLWLCREISDLSSHLCIEQWYILINEARALRQSPPGRIRRLITEITSLKTGLSSGIYVKHAISRPDMMKILIVGPEGTPYENVVCLSLLGTWFSGAKGEEWQPGVSTILQVLISIQAMILCEDPENNEPGYAARYGRRLAGPSAYTMSARSLTVVYAIRNWANQPPALWKDIAEAHFKRTANKILQTAERWAKESRQPS
ncbi:uncharacterized protein SETTUDRAFT_78313, partial [Exserohilum turcica Et28A]